MVATATNYLPLAHVGSHCVDAVKRWAARLGRDVTLVSVCHGARENDEEREKKNNKREDPKVQIQGITEQGGNFLISIKAIVHHTVALPGITLLYVCVRHFLKFHNSQSTSFTLLFTGA